MSASEIGGVAIGVAAIIVTILLAVRAAMIANERRAASTDTLVTVVREEVTMLRVIATQHAALITKHETILERRRLAAPSGDG